MPIGNIFELIPAFLESEVFEDIIATGNVRIERILSQGQSSPATGWYDQDENEWVMVLQGRARLGFVDGNEVSLESGNYVNIPAHTKHRVVWTDPARVTIWLAVFWRDVTPGAD